MNDETFRLALRTLLDNQVAVLFVLGELMDESKAALHSLLLEDIKQTRALVNELDALFKAAIAAGAGSAWSWTPTTPHVVKHIPDHH